MPAPSLSAPAPDFSLPGSAGRKVRLKALRGRHVILYFYPRDNTPGCTRESQDFRDFQPDFAATNAVILGISRDSLASHERFAAAQRLPFPLLADTEGEVCRLYDVIREKNMYGRKVVGIERSTFLVDAQGTLRREWRKVKVPGHAWAVLEAVRLL